MSTHEPYSLDEATALSDAAQEMAGVGIDIKLPWNGDLDDLERSQFEGLVAACRAYSEGLLTEEHAKALDVIDDLPLETAREALAKSIKDNAALLAERDDARREAHAWSQNAIKQVGEMRAALQKIAGGHTDGDAPDVMTCSPEQFRGEMW